MAVSMETLQNLLQQLNTVSPSDMAPLFAATRQVKLDAGETYIREGDSARKLAYLEKGIIRAYAVMNNGDEATLFLRCEGQFIASHDTIIRQRPSRFIYRALEDVIMVEIDYDQLEAVLRENPRLEPLRSYFLQLMLAEALDSIEAFVTLSPEERYLQLLESRGDMVNRVPDKYIASMLGVTPVSLSRIRKRIHSRGKQ
ncbi:Crp/Fnr family transcriptional regulator [Chitinophaga varians]|uniref:Crp/Fnr family transcriptional regulator n=1 Tax=Chitinophaga varians TaxID=2202339 RepID=UPI00165FDE81|nr:Crp/Fnr family transcriptional regulator [Chitinophaga varians]MBC9909511.1 Crp/Fnr family transcriptional regulator [Chitinophaga varians]